MVFTWPGLWDDIRTWLMETTDPYVIPDLSEASEKHFDKPDHAPPPTTIQLGGTDGRFA